MILGSDLGGMIWVIMVGEFFGAVILVGWSGWRDLGGVILVGE